MMNRNADTPTSPAPFGSVSDRVKWVDYAKGICIILVVMMHTTLGVSSRWPSAGFMEYAVEFAKPFRMPDFFLLSGLFLSRVIDRNWRKYLDLKVIHFAYFYVLWTFLQFAFKVPVAVSKNEYDFLEPFAWTFIQPYETLWFIYMLPIFFVVCKMLKTVPPLPVLLFAAALETMRIHTGWVLIDEFASRWFYFVFGWLCAPFVFRFAEGAAKNGLLAIAGLTVWFGVNAFCVFGPAPVYLAPRISELPLVSIALGLAGAMAVVTIAAQLNRFEVLRFVRYCGQNSIVIYLSFFIPMVIIRGILLKFQIISDPGFVALIVTAGAVATPVIAHHLVKGTSLSFLFERPARFRLKEAAKVQPAE